MKIVKAIFLSAVLFGCASLDKLTPASKEIAIDGSADDWPQLVHFNDDAGLVYGVSYDDDHLFIFAKAYKDDAIKRIMSSGLTIWVEPNGKKKKNIGVTYPIMSTPPAENRAQGDGKPRGKNVLNDAQLNTLMIQGLISDEKQVIQKNYLKTDMDVMIGMDTTQNLLFEMKIPLVLLEQKTDEDLKKIAIGFELGELAARPNRGNGPPNVGGRGGGGGRSGGGPPGGNRGGGTPSSGAPGMTQSKAEIVWYVVEI